jgi:hypothetical protein
MFRKVLKKILLAVLFIVGIPVVLLLLYVLFNLNLFHKTKKLTATHLNSLVERIDPVQSDPFRFVAEKFDNHSIVFLGEMHRRKQDLEFFAQLIPYLYQTKKINVIGWEFGAQEFQKDADSIVSAGEFDRKKAIAIMRRSMYNWPWEEYLNIFKRIWETNKTITDTNEKIRFLQLNEPFIPKIAFSKDPITRNMAVKSIDSELPGIVEREVLLKNKKALIYCGLNHSLTKFETPKFFFLRDNGRAGQALHAKYPNKLFQIDLLSPFPDRWTIYYALQHNYGFTHQEVSKYVYPFEGIFNQIYDTLKRPFAINSNDVHFSNIKDYNSFYAFDKWGGVELKDFCDGCIMLESFDKTEPVHFVNDWVTTEEELNEVKNSLTEEDAKNIKTITDLINYLNPDAAIKNMRQFHDLKKFW